MSSVVWESVGLGTLMLVGLHVALWRLRPSNAPRMGRLALLGAAGFAVAMAATLWRAGLNAEALYAAAGLQSGVVVTYLVAYAALARSVSLTLLSRVRQAGGAPVAFNQLVEEYLASSRFEDRIRVMDESGFLECVDDCVVLTRRGERLARSAQRMSSWLQGTLQG